MIALGIRGQRKLKISLVYLFLALSSIFVFFPFVWMILTSLKTNPEALRIPPTWVPQKLTFEAYIAMWIRKPFGIYFINSVIISFSTAAISTFLGGLAGYGFSRFMFRGKTLLLGAFLATQMLPGGLLIGPYFKILGRVGLFNTRTGLIIAFITICLPFSTWMLKGFFDTIPPELDQAAMIDGCSRLGAFRRVLLPVAKPGMVATVLFAFLLAWGDVLWALCLTSTHEMSTVTLGILRFVGEFQVYWPMLMAGSIIGSIPAIILYVLLQKFLIAGLTAGAMKG
ncbi:MAG: carbohydrate ABC transporter permease [bacterium]